jgi:hypothetical protein
MTRNSNTTCLFPIGEVVQFQYGRLVQIPQLLPRHLRWALNCGNIHHYPEPAKPVDLTHTQYGMTATIEEFCSSQNVKVTSSLTDMTYPTHEAHP